MKVAPAKRVLRRVDVVGECWIFRGAKSSGYGVVNVGWGLGSAHRVVYEHLVGPIPAGFTLDHVASRGCTSRACVNPAHLEPVTAAENALRGNGPPAQNARMTRCAKGHEFTRVKRQRICLTCKKAWTEADKLKKIKEASHEEP